MSATIEARSGMRPDTVHITALVNNALPEPLGCEHGLSLWIEYADRHILFDTGQTPLLLANADRLGIDLSQADAIVISHGHYDHTGGLAAVLERAPDAAVCLHPAAVGAHYSRHPGKGPRDIAMPPPSRAVLTDARVIRTDKPFSLAPGLLVTGQIPRLNPYEDTTGPFFLDSDAQTPDPLADDQALLIATSAGLVAVLGCAHAGVINTLDYAASLCTEPLFALIGGLHLNNASDGRFSSTLAALRQYNLGCVAPCHCSGDRALRTLEQSYPAAFHDFSRAARLTI